MDPFKTIWTVQNYFWPVEGLDINEFQGRIFFFDEIFFTPSHKIGSFFKPRKNHARIGRSNSTPRILTLNSGIGLALCKILVRDHSCYVYLGSRDVSRGNEAMKKILEEGRNLDKSNKIEVIQIDVGDDESCISAAKSLEVKFQFCTLLLCSWYVIL